MKIRHVQCHRERLVQPLYTKTDVQTHLPTNAHMICDPDIWLTLFYVHLLIYNMYKFKTKFVGVQYVE